MKGKSAARFSLFHAVPPLALGLLLVGTSPAATEEIRGPFFWGSFEAATEDTPDILHDTSASFTWEERLYHLYATDAPGMPARQILEEQIAALAPGLSLDCFHRRTAGTWDDLAAAGIGDPRPALQPAPTRQELRLLYYAAPAAGCSGAIEAPDLPLELFARFDQPGGRRTEVRVEWIETSGDSRPGRVSESGAEWTKGHLAFSVATEGQGANEKAVTEIARALDPTFEAACQRRTRELDNEQLALYGLRAPIVPPGFKRVAAKQMAASLPGGCPRGIQDPGEIELRWAFSSPDILLEAGASRGTPEAREALRENPLIGEGYVRWKDAKGVSFYVYAHPPDEGPGLSEAELFAIARSLDPHAPLPAPGPR